MPKLPLVGYISSQKIRTEWGHKCFHSGLLNGAGESKGKRSVDEIKNELHTTVRKEGGGCLVVEGEMST